MATTTMLDRKISIHISNKPSGGRKTKTVILGFKGKKASVKPGKNGRPSSTQQALKRWSVRPLAILGDSINELPSESYDNELTGT